MSDGIATTSPDTRQTLPTAVPAAAGGDAVPLRSADRRPSAIGRMLRSDRVAALAILVILAIVVVALLAPVLPLASPTKAKFSQKLLPPLSEGHILGTDQLGRDTLSRLIWGARVSLVVGTLAAIIAASVGAFIGVVSGYLGGKVDNLIMRVIDIMLAFPYILLAIGLVAALGPGLVNAMLAIAVANISFYARNMRGNVLSVRNQPYIESAFAAGASHRSILFRHVLPNIMPSLLVLVSLNIGWMITETAGSELPRPRRAAADRRLGLDAGRRPPVHHGDLLPGDDSGDHDLDPRARAQRPRRFAPRRPGPPTTKSVTEGNRCGSSCCAGVALGGGPNANRSTAWQGTRGISTR